MKAAQSHAASRVHRFSRWLHHQVIDPKEWYRPVLQAALREWPESTRFSIALDTTALTPFVLICASLVYPRRAIPLAWRAMHRETGSTQVGFQDYLPVLEALRLMLGERKIVLLADRGFGHEQLIPSLLKHQWHFRLRLKGNTLVRLKDRHTSAMKDFCPPAGQTCFFQGESLLGNGVGPVHLALTHLIDQPDVSWYVASSEPTNAKTFDEYSMRFEHSRNLPG